MTGDCCVFKFLRCSVDGKYFMRFQSKTFVFKFLRRGGLDMRVKASTLDEHRKKGKRAKRSSYRFGENYSRVVD